MVNFIIATHGEFASGIKMSGQMIFGEQENVQVVTFMPSEGPEDLTRKFDEALAQFDADGQVLFLVDLWGGSPFNAASRIVSTEGNEDRMAILAGLNFPMLIEAYGARMTYDTAREIAEYLLPVSKEGIKAFPDTIKDTSATAAQVATPAAQGAIPEGTVLGDGHLKYVLSRIDSRLLHGQVATAWSKETKPDRIIVVSDSVSQDKMRKTLIMQASPAGIHANVIPIDKMIEVAKDPRFGATKAMVLFETPQDALRAIEGGVDIKTLNVGSMAHSVGKVQTNTVLAFDQNDIDTFAKLKALGIEFDVRKVPADSKGNMDNIIAKAQAEINKEKK
ncbi:MAG: mannose/fructose/sorbose PTS transporter subunit IIA [Lactobacillaceae bacterium]|jgi:PTS system mannose-specific IIB component|nr:mannose/fructose/sorbose PTS transporter subunit IIA [Lactobacillaceae bacterium]